MVVVQLVVEEMHLDVSDNSPGQTEHVGQIDSTDVLHDVYEGWDLEEIVRRF